MLAKDKTIWQQASLKDQIQFTFSVSRIIMLKLVEGFLLKGQLISKTNFKVFIWTKNQRKYFCISALASKSGQIKKI